ncbi:Serine/threonine-protein kinase/endoribonuclease ire-1 [Morus notabilis]|uniref:non-specific serine/threonine protein kinase n=1 Tax=Morus notabilis TaxID=981085 RepID=W9SA54_9ROSA|nr:Serine/threonine-protein kinase/endoribonuclease ire-1 [Morus notabilis]
MLCNNVNKQRGEITISSSEVSCDANDQLEIGEKLVVFLLKVINISGSGTAIYKGSYKDRVVAVKRILRSHIILANQEIANLKAFQQHQNVVRFYGEGRDRDFLYLALELCDCDLNDLIQLYSPDSSQNMTISSNLEKLRNNLGDVQLWKENNGRPSPLLLKLMRDMVSGLVVVHDMGIIHRDLKPQNILIIKESSTLCAKISDMGISRKLRDNKASLSNHFSRCGTTGWKAKEWLLFERQTLAMDLFSLGCLLFFCITHGRHPFGDHDERNRNIRNDDAQDLYLVQDFPEAFHLISLLLKADHNLRILTGKMFLKDDSLSKFKGKGAESTTSDDIMRQIGKKLLVSTKEIGKSGTGTVVYEGRYNDIAVAVKRIQQSHGNMADREITNFIAISKQNENIVRYYGAERDRDFIYLILELCHCNLDDLIQIYSTNSSKHQHVSEYLEKVKNIFGDVKLWKENDRPSPLLLKLMRGIVSGLVDLHNSRIIHRDLKPENVLIIGKSSGLCAKLSDMGISRQLRDNKSSLTNNISRCGTMGWKAKECLLADERPPVISSDQRLTTAMDLFSLGCLLFFCITRGIHPFGEHDERNMNIKKDIVQNLNLLHNFPEAFELISLLLKADHQERPKANEVLLHPLFWDAEKRLSFLRDTSDRVTKNSDISNALESTADTIFETEMMCLLNVVLKWNKKVNDKIIKHISTYAREAYKFNSVRDLLRLIGDICKHYQQLPDNIQRLVGSCYEEIDDYFTWRFPMLLIEVYKVVCTHCKKEKRFGKYFNQNKGESLAD